MAYIALENVCLRFRIRRHGRVSLKEFLVRQMFRTSRNPIAEIRALENVSFRVNAGERLGIIGHNGSGKSTLLRLLAGVYPPTRGRRSVHGRIGSLFDIALGSVPDANGWSN